MERREERRHSKYKGGFMLSDPTKDRSVGRLGLELGREGEGGHALASIPYNQRRRFSKETRYRTRVRFTITYPTRSIPAIVAVEQSSRVRFQNTYFGAKFEWNQNFLLRREGERQRRRTKERLARRRSCFFQRGLFGRTERLPLSRRRR